ncbi:MAG: NADH:flavin oxidoreductase [Lentisphaeria bacterium]|nr:NADH:flavin oxidoreductase [Lentisphaeria bacterium]
MSDILFSPARIGRLEVRNRFVRSATHEGLATAEGLHTPELSAVLERLAQGELGLIVTGHSFVSPEGRAGRNQAAADSDTCIAPWRETVRRIHAAGAKIVLQLAHAGGQAADAELAAGPSACASGRNRPPCREMTAGDISEVVRRFGDAARRAREAGFDGVQIHAAHGYLISQFLSGFYNRRADAYGGTPENRARLLFEVFDAVRVGAGPGFPVLAKINSADFAPGGFSASSCAAVCRGLAERGLDAVELSGGIPEAGPELSPVRTVDPQPGEPAYYEETARMLKPELPVPLLLVGGIRDAAAARRLVTEGVCDFVSLCRPLIREPELVKRWKGGSAARSRCVSCNGCFRPVMTGRGLYCPPGRRKEERQDSCM